MAAISAADVKKLRDLTSAGMMECKKALEEADGDFDKAVEVLRISGAAKAAKRGAERTASNGVVAAKGNVMVEVLCETDFVAKNSDFQKLVHDIVEAAAAQRPTELSGLKLADGRTAGDAVAELAGVIGEKLELGRYATLDGDVAIYLHKRAQDLPPSVGVIVSFEGSEEAARGAAMQVAAMRPQYLVREEVPADTIENEKRIAEATAREEGKPEAALPKIVEGRVNGFYKETVLMEQSSVIDNKKTVAAVMAEAGTTLKGFIRFEVGQG